MTTSPHACTGGLCRLSSFPESGIFIHVQNEGSGSEARRPTHLPHTRICASWSFTEAGVGVRWGRYRAALGSSDLLMGLSPSCWFCLRLSSSHRLSSPEPKLGASGASQSLWSPHPQPCSFVYPSSPFPAGDLELPGAPVSDAEVTRPSSRSRVTSLDCHV